MTNWLKSWWNQPGEDFAKQNAKQYARALSYREALSYDEVAHDFVGGVMKYYHVHGDAIAKQPFFSLSYEGASGTGYVDYIMHTNTLHLFVFLHRLGIRPKI